MRLLHPRRVHTALLPVYVANLLFSFHYNILVYVNSSFLRSFFEPSTVSLLYMAGAVGTMVLFSFLLKGESTYGNRKMFSFFIFLELIAVGGIALAPTPHTAAFFFVLFQATFLLIVFTLDVFLEAATPEKATGRVRGIYLTLGNLALASSPLMIALIAPNGEFNHLYILSALLLLPLFFLGVTAFTSFKDSAHQHTSFPFMAWWKSKNVRSVTEVRFALDIFYSFMVIFMPIYVRQFIGFSWTEISIMFTIMLLPFVLFEIPFGTLADKWCGEKELMTLGLFIIGCTMILAPFLTVPNLAAWTLLLFVSRVGASMVEVTAESYFFKHVSKQDTGLISIFRLSWPAAFIVGPFLGWLSLHLFSYPIMFFVLALIILKAMDLSSRLRDTL